MGTATGAGCGAWSDDGEAVNTDPAFLRHYAAVTEAEAARRNHQPEFAAWQGRREM